MENNKSMMQTVKETFGVGEHQTHKDNAGVAGTSDMQKTKDEYGADRSQLQQAKDAIGVGRSKTQEAKDKVGHEKSMMQKARDAMP